MRMMYEKQGCSPGHGHEDQDKVTVTKDVMWLNHPSVWGDCGEEYRQSCGKTWSRQACRGGTDLSSPRVQQGATVWAEVYRSVCSSPILAPVPSSVLCPLHSMPPSLFLKGFFPSSLRLGISDWVQAAEEISRMSWIVLCTILLEQVKMWLSSWHSVFPDATKNKALF